MTAAPSLPNFGNPISRKTLPRANGVIVGVMALAMGGVVLSTGTLDAAALGMMLFALALLALCAWSFSYSATIYQHGATVATIFGTRSLAFTDLKTFSYSRMLLRGQPQDSITFVPRSGEALRIVTQPRPGSGPDDDLSQLVEMFGASLAERMERELLRGKTLPWVERVPRRVPAQPEVGLTREAFVYREGERRVTAKFSQVESEIVGGLFKVQDRQSGKTLFSLPCAAINFYPGYLAYQRLRSGAAAPSTPATPAATH